MHLKSKYNRSELHDLALNNIYIVLTTQTLDIALIRNWLNYISESHSVVPNSLQPHWLYSLWNSPGQKTGVYSHSLLQRIFPTQESNPGLPVASRFTSWTTWKQYKKDKCRDKKVHRYGFPGGAGGKEPACQCRRDLGSISGLGSSPGGGHGNPLQYSCLENPMDRGAWGAAVYRVTKSWTRLKWLSVQHACRYVQMSIHTHVHLFQWVEVEVRVWN